MCHRVEDSAARHELQRGIVPSAVDELVREIGLLVLSNADNGEDQPLTVLQCDIDLVTELQLIQVIKNRGAGRAVDMAQDDG